MWRFVNRKSALAALAGRAMLEKSEDHYRLVGVFGDLSRMGTDSLG